MPIGNTTAVHSTWLKPSVLSEALRLSTKKLAYLKYASNPKFINMDKAKQNLR